MRLRLGGLSNERDLEHYASWLLQLGDGLLPEHNGQVDLLPTLCLDSDVDLSGLIQWTFPNLASNYDDLSWMTGRAILAPHNATVDEINNTVSNLIPGRASECVSADAIIDDNTMHVPMEYLNSLQVPGIPAHQLYLKPGMPLILLRTLNTKDGLCNGTRLVLQRLINNHLLEVKVVNTNHVAFIPRITLRPNDDTFPFTWERRQFPVSPAFAMTINKAQGQTLSRVGIYLSSPVFTHGQLYVAASRVSDPKNIAFCIKSSPNSNTNTQNVVYKEVLC